VRAGKIAGKLVLIGTSAVGLNDIKTTPVDPAMPGVEIHAQVLESALTGAVLSQPSYGIVSNSSRRSARLLVIAFAPLFGPSRWSRRRAVRDLLIGTSWYFYAQHKLLIDFTYPLLSTTAIYLTLIFSSFVASSAAAADPLGVRPVSVAGAGRAAGAVAGKARARRRGARDDHHVLRRARLHHDLGNLQARSAGPDRADEPLPDAADQRDPRAQGHHRQIYGRRHHGVLERAARRQGASAQRLRGRARHAGADRRAQQGARAGGKDGGHVYIPLNVGVGLNTGVCVVGNMGSDLRFDYSVLGDSVNLASRLEGQSKEYGFPIIVGSKTALAVKDKFAILELDFIMVKGKKEPEVIYAIAGREDTAHSGRFQRLRNLTIEMLACYRSRDWDGALAAIERGRAPTRPRAGAALQSL
jgi:adenylate cyclase